MLFLTSDATVTQNDQVRGTWLAEGSVVLDPDEAQHFALNVLTVYRDKMRENAGDMRAAASAIRVNPAPEPATPGYISILPYPDGLDRLAIIFDEQAERASAQISELQGPEDE